MVGRFVGPVVFVALLAAACSNNKSFLNQDDPFDDPFFHDGFGGGTSSLDEIMREPAPSVGWLAAEGAVPPPRGSRGPDGGATSGPDGEGVLLEAEGDGSYVPPDSGDDDDGMPGRGEKSFYDKASEATMATMSVLVGAGMAALPFLIGT